MLADTQRRLVQRLYSWSKLGIYALASILVVSLEWVLLIMVDDIVFDSSGVYEVGLFAYFPIIIVLLALALVFLIWTTATVKKREWADIERIARQPCETGEVPSSLTAGVSIDEEGTIERLSFDATIDASLAPEENLAQVEADFTRLAGMLAGIDAPAASPALLAADAVLPEEFRQRFSAGSYIRGVLCSRRGDRWRGGLCAVLDVSGRGLCQ